MVNERCCNFLSFVPYSIEQGFKSCRSFQKIKTKIKQTLSAFSWMIMLHYLSQLVDSILEFRSLYWKRIIDIFMHKTYLFVPRSELLIHCRYITDAGGIEFKSFVEV